MVAEGTAPGEPLPTVAGLADLAGLRFADLLAEAGFVDRIGMAGAQDKLSAGMITLPMHLATGPAIIKLDPPDYPDAVANEYYFLGVARRLRLPVVATELVRDRDGRPGLLVARFDRRPQPGGATLRLAVEDAAQLMNRYPADKYSVTSEEASIALSSVCAASVVAARACLQQFALAWLTGNGDEHAGRISRRSAEPSGEWRVAPIYDIPSTLPYGDRTMALSLQGAESNLSRRRFRAFGSVLGLPAAAVDRALTEVLRATEPMLDELRDGALPGTSTFAAGVVRGLTTRRRRLTSRRRHDRNRVGRRTVSQPPDRQYSQRMNAFWESVASNVIGTFVGAGLALLTSFFVVRHGETQNDLRLLQALIDRLYRSRALRPNQVPGRFDTAEARENERRSTKSVLATRDRIAVTSDGLSGHSDAFDELDRMHVACLRYLNEVQDDPSQYIQNLMTLRNELEPEVERLCSRYGSLRAREIGAADLRNRAADPG